MKKIFVEPSIRKIELNLSENIATSGMDSGGIHFMSHYLECTIQDTKYTYYSENVKFWELFGCLTNFEEDTSRGTVIPEKVFRMQKRL